MHAGRKDEKYLANLAQLDWLHFFRFEQGEEFFENLRAGALSQFGCRHIISDSRTGLTDIGGVCTGFLADAVVLVFQPTSAHAQGLKFIARALRRREQKKGDLSRVCMWRRGFKYHSRTGSTPTCAAWPTKSSANAKMLRMRVTMCGNQ